MRKIPETIMIVGPTESGFMVINKRDFNPSIHERFVAKESVESIPLKTEAEVKTVKPKRKPRAKKKTTAAKG